MTITSRTAAGVVLCGGLSTRMRRPKALLPWRGGPLVTHVVTRLRDLFEEVVVVTSSDLELPTLSARVVVDREPALGPLGGIREGLHAVESELAFVCSTDSPVVDAEFASSLLARGRTAACEVGGFIEPFPAVYERRLAAVADALLGKGRMRPLHLLEAAGFDRVDGSEWIERSVFAGFNSPGEYLAAVARDASSQGVVVRLSGRLRESVGSASVEKKAGTLREVLESLGPDLELCRRGRVAPGVRLSLHGVGEVDDLEMPIGPGDRLQVLEANGED